MKEFGVRIKLFLGVTFMLLCAYAHAQDKKDKVDDEIFAGTIACKENVNFRNFFKTQQARSILHDVFSVDEIDHASVKRNCNVKISSVSGTDTTYRFQNGEIDILYRNDANDAFNKLIAFLQNDHAGLIRC